MRANNKNIFIKRHSLKRQSGVLLLEALIAILVFSFGVLAIVGLQAASINMANDARHRADAAYIANQIINEIWTTLPTNAPANLAVYQLNAASAQCANTTNTSANNTVKTWLDGFTKTTSMNYLPGSQNRAQRIIVNGNTVTVNICWQAPQDRTPHSYTAVTVIGR